MLLEKKAFPNKSRNKISNFILSAMKYENIENNRIYEW